MPFIRGRYHINPIAGEALEAAREAQAALLAEQHGDGNENPFEEKTRGAASEDAKGPIHRVEIEAAEMVPSHSGRAVRGFVARVHREAAGHPAAPSRPGELPVGAFAPRPETHVFSDHRDLVNFLHGEFAKDCARR